MKAPPGVSLSALQAVLGSHLRFTLSSSFSQDFNNANCFPLCFIQSFSPFSTITELIVENLENPLSVRFSFSFISVYTFQHV